MKLLTKPTDILLVAVNARYSHCSYAVRTLKANLGKLAERADFFETDLDVTPLQLVSEIVMRKPRVVSFSVYLWNVRLVEAAARILRIVAPRLRLVAGGPELTPDYPHAALFDALILGEGESAFRAFCEHTLSRPPTSDLRPLTSDLRPLTSDLSLPYDLYTDTDIKHRTVYVESSRGCPYKCAYCTSADTGLRLIPLDRLLPAFDRLWQRGLRRFKFLDRSFNVAVEHACAVLDFFRERVTSNTTCLHFEIQPDHLHPDVARRLAEFPQGVLHLEVGIQTLNPSAAAAIGRSPDTARTLANLRFLTRETSAIVHADIIFGLPGEDAASFAQGFNTLVNECAPPELQINLLKGLPGTRFAINADLLGLRFSSDPPYELLRSDAMDFETLCRIQRFARCWELVHNRGHFPDEVRRLHALAGSDPYTLYHSLAECLHTAEGKLYAISRPRLATLIHSFLQNPYLAPER